MCSSVFSDSSNPSLLLSSSEEEAHITPRTALRFVDTYEANDILIEKDQTASPLHQNHPQSTAAFSPSKLSEGRETWAKMGKHKKERAVVCRPLHFPCPAYPSPARAPSQAPACNCGTEQAPSSRAQVVPDGPGSSAPKQQMIARRNEFRRQENFLHHVSEQARSPACTALQNKVGTKHTQNISPSLVQAALCQVLYLAPAGRRAAEWSATDTRETEHTTWM